LDGPILAENSPQIQASSSGVIPSCCPFAHANGLIGLDGTSTQPNPTVRTVSYSIRIIARRSALGGHDLLAQRPQPQEERACLGRAVADMQALDARETLEAPAHSGPARRLLDR
jgi:hypothetical protein